MLGTTMSRSTIRSVAIIGAGAAGTCDRPPDTKGHHLTIDQVPLQLQRSMQRMLSMSYKYLSVGKHQEEHGIV